MFLEEVVAEESSNVMSGFVDFIEMVFDTFGGLWEWLTTSLWSVNGVEVTPLTLVFGVGVTALIGVFILNLIIPG